MGNRQNSGTDSNVATESVSTRTKKFFSKRFKKYWREIIVIILFGLATGAVYFFWSPFDAVFMERDPSLSFPYHIDSQCIIPIPLIIFLSIGVPFILTFALQMTIRFWRRPENIHPKAIDPFYGFLVIAEGLAINGLLSEFLKTYVGKKRPNFFAMCNYHGYNDAILTNNFTYYFAHTDANRFGSTANCWDQTSFAIVQGRSSFPSGHATYAFCGYTLWSLLSVYVWHCITKGHKAFKVLYFLVFMLIALVLSWSRALDYWHTPSDIFAGAAIGGIVGSLVFLLNYSFSTVDKLKKNLERDIRTVKNEDPESATKEATKQDNSVKNMSKKLNKTDQNTAKDKSDQYINYTYT